jgi:DNA-binding NarL/FixJ family response regulator
MPTPTDTTQTTQTTVVSSAVVLIAHLQQAVRVFGEGGARLHPTVTSRVIAVYRKAPAPAPRTDDDLAILTAREREVLALIGDGQTNAEIASELYVGAGTVKTYVHHIFTKLNLRNRAAAVSFALDHDLASRRAETE